MSLGTGRALTNPVLGGGVGRSGKDRLEERDSCERGRQLSLPEDRVSCEQLKVALQQSTLHV